MGGGASSQPKVQEAIDGGRNKVCIVSCGNAAHALAAMWPHMGFDTYIWSGFQDEAERMTKGLEAGPITATFAEGNPFEGDIKGSPTKVAKDPAEVIPQADVIFAPLPSFAYASVFTALKPHLKEGQYICITPGAGGVDWIAYNILGEELFKKITLFTVSPMPFNCRIEEWSRSVKVQVLKQRYDICAHPVEKLNDCCAVASALLPKSTCNPLGPILAATLIPLNPVIHPARVYTLLTEHNDWAPGKTLPENPLFYESMTTADTSNQIKINDELDMIVAAANKAGITLQVPNCYNFLAKTYDGVSGSYPQKEKPTPEDLVHLWSGPMYKGFKCPLKQEGEGWVPDFENRYFTEDIPCGLCTYKGVAELFGVETPFMDKIIMWAQGYMKKDYIIDGKLNETLIEEMFVPQRYGLKTVPDLKKAMGVDDAAAPKEKKKSVCIVSCGNAAHALAAMWPHMGFDTYMWSGYQDEAERMTKGLEAGPITATFAEGNPFVGDIKGSPIKVAKDPAEVIPLADVIFAPLPSFAYQSVFTDLKPHLREGHYVCVTPGAGGVDWIAYNVLGEELFNKITIFTVSPMPFNCRIDEWSRSVKVQVLKQRYDICAQPVSKLGDCVEIAKALLPKSECTALGPILAATLIPLNPVIHPARVYTLLTEHNQWEPGKTLPENPFFYEQMTTKDTSNQIKINDELDLIVAKANEAGIELKVPNCYNFLAKTYDGVSGSYPQKEKPTPEDLVHLWSGPMYKGFHCPLKQEGDGWVPDFDNRYFTEDIPCGLCTYKGVAELFGQETPFMDQIIMWAQGYMKKDYIVDGKLNESLIGEMFVPQRYGIKTVADLKKAMGIA